MTFRVAALDAGHDLRRFVCGHPDLDVWLRDHARHAAAQGTRTYLLLHGDDDAIAGYFAIAPHVLERDDAPRNVGRGAPRHIPSILLAKLALARNRQGHGLGAELLLHALGIVLDAARRAGGKIVVVDAIDARAAAFYRHHDFEPLPNRPDRLVLKLSTAARALGVPWGGRSSASSTRLARAATSPVPHRRVATARVARRRQ